MIRLENATLKDDAEQLSLAVVVRNLSRQVLHAYAEASAFHYQPATRKLAIDLTPKAAAMARPSGLYHPPRVVSLPANAETRFELELPRVLSHMTSSSAGPAPTIERWAIHEATSFEVSLAWSDVPLARDVDPSSGWEKGRVSAEFQRSP